MPQAKDLIREMTTQGWLRWREESTETGTQYKAKVPSPPGTLLYQVVPASDWQVGVSLSFLPDGWNRKKKGGDENDPPEIILFGPDAKPVRYSQQWRVTRGIVAPPTDEEGNLDPYIQECLEGLVSNHFSRNRFAAERWIQEAVPPAGSPARGALRRHFGLTKGETITQDMIKDELKSLRQKAQNGKLSPEDLKLLRRLQLAKTLIGITHKRQKKASDVLSEARKNFLTKSMSLLDDGYIKKVVNRWRHAGTELDRDDLAFAAQEARRLSRKVVEAMGGRPFRGPSALLPIRDRKRRLRIQDAVDDLVPKIKEWAYRALADIYLEYPEDPRIGKAMRDIREILSD